MRQARSLTGFRADWSDPLGRYTNFRLDSRRHDTGAKTVFGQTGAFALGRNPDPHPQLLMSFSTFGSWAMIEIGTS